MWTNRIFTDKSCISELRRKKSQREDKLQPHLSVSGSKKTPSRSSPALPLLGTNRPGVDVLTMGTDWEASSLVSDWAASEKTVTGGRRWEKQDPVDDLMLLNPSANQQLVKCCSRRTMKRQTEQKRLSRSEGDIDTWCWNLQRRGGNAATTWLFLVSCREQGTFEQDQT